MRKPSITKGERVASPKSVKKRQTTSKKLLGAKTPFGNSPVVDPVRFGSLSENAYIYTKEGVDEKFNKIKSALEPLNELMDLCDLDDGCTMYDIRQTMQTIVQALVDISTRL